LTFTPDLQANIHYIEILNKFIFPNFAKIRDDREGGEGNERDTGTFGG
jgi:hypothetical protein